MPKIKIVTDSIFSSSCQAYVNPVNCIGVMGAGLAKAFKERFPQASDKYMLACEEAKVRLGFVYPVDSNVLTPEWIIHFPTKDHWTEKSRIGPIKSGLVAMLDFVLEYNIDSIAIPALGCGLGGLDWNEVKREITSAANSYLSSNKLVELYPPR